MKRAIIVTALTGFVRAFLLYDIELLKELGYEVDCAANGNGDKESELDNKRYFKKLNVKFHQIDFSSNKPISKETIKSYGQLKELLRENMYDLVLIHTPIPGVLMRLATKNLRKKTPGLKVIYTTHGFYFHEKCSKKQKLIYYNIEKLMSKYTDAIITINNEDFMAAKTMNCKKVFHINGVGVNTKKYEIKDFDRDMYRKKLNISEDKIALLSIGELSYRKNYQVAIKAIAKIENKNLVYLICGKGLVGSGIMDELKKEAEDFGVDVRFLGYRTDIPEIIASSDIGIIPSNREGLGLAGIEMLAGGIPVVGSSVQGIKDYIVDGKTGYLADPYSDIEFSEALKKLLNKEKRKKMIGNCIEMAKNFDDEVSHNQIKKIYCEIDNAVEEQIYGK